MSQSNTKQVYPIDANNAIRKAYNFEDDTLSVNGFIVGKVGLKVTMTIQTTNVANDTEQFTFSDQSPIPNQENPTGSPITLYVIDVVYTDGTRSTFLSAERTA